MNTDHTEPEPPAGYDTTGTTTRPAVGCVFGGGGPFGIAWMLGVLEELRCSGVPVQLAPTTATSAGTWVAGALRCGVDIEPFAQLRNPVRPTGDPDVLWALAASLFGDVHVPDLGAVAVPFPGVRRTVLDGKLVPLAVQIAASSALPGLVPPFRHGSARFVDGGVVSSTSADLAGPADRLIVLAPLAGASLTGGGRLVSAQLRHETDRWRNRHGGQVTVIRPDRTAAQLAGLPHRLFETGRMMDVHRAGRMQGRRVVDLWYAASPTVSQEDVPGVSVFR